MKRSTLTTVVALALSLSACGKYDPTKPENKLMTALRIGLAFKACSSQLQSRVASERIEGVASSDVDPVSTGKPGEWDVKFTADLTEKDGRVTRYRSVCHVRRDKATWLDARFLSEIKPPRGTVRRSPIGSIVNSGGR